jgi:NTP pyrophosphatase (non-canonical NTP hydrolase)
MDDKILEKIKLARENDPRKSMTVSDKMVKLQEEIGEIAAAHMRELGLKPRSEGMTIKSVRDNKKEEYADALIVIYDMILADGFTFEEIKEELNKGVDKWYNKVKELKQ